MLYSPSTVIESDLSQQEADLLPNTPAGEPNEASGFGDPNAPDAAVLAAEAEGNPSPSPGTGTKTTPAAPVDAKALMDAINADRENREASAAAKRERDEFKARAEAAEAKLTAQDKARQNRLLDPAGFLRKMGYTDRELALTAEGIMFSLMPEKAPPDHRAKLVEAQMLRNREEDEEREKSRSTESEKKAQADREAQEKQVIETYQANLKQAASKFPPGAYPASQAWFANDHDAYSRELLATSKALADQAVKAGTGPIDLSPQALAPHVEKKLAEKFARFKAAAPTQPAARPVTGSPAPQAVRQVLQEQAPRKLTEKEIIERATKAAFSF